MEIHQIQYDENASFHMIRHFQELPEQLLNSLLKKGFTIEEIQKEQSTAGSRFYAAFAVDIPSLLQQVFSNGFDESIGGNGNTILSGSVTSLAFPNGIGTNAVVNVSNLNEKQQSNIYIEQYRDTQQKHLKVEQLPSTDSFVVVLRKTDDHYIFITAFPGHLALPFPTAAMEDELRAKCIAFWEQHVFLSI
jgi:hypothetical protein